jgi:hypothetical protein
MVTGFVQSLIKLCGLDWTAPDYSTICRRQKHIDIQISYEKSCNGLHLLVDSTGLKFLGEGEWKRKKHQPEYRRQWRKLHIGIDAETLQIRAVQLTTNNVSDSQCLVIYSIRFHKMNNCIPYIPMELMIPSNADRSLQIGKHMQ